MDPEAQQAPQPKEPASTRRRQVGPRTRVLEVESLAFGGEGVTRVGGKVRFVYGAYPGEQVEAQPLSARRRFERMRMLRVLRPSPNRRLPLCPHQSVCGGCATQTLRYETQLQEKARQVRDCLERIGHLQVREAWPPLPAPVLSGYRNKMEFSFAPRPWLPDGPPEGPIEGPALGLHVRGRYDAVFDLTGCILPSGNAVRAVETVRSFAKARGLGAWKSGGEGGLLRHLVFREGKNTGESLLAIVASARHPAFDDLGPVLARAVPGLAGLVLILNDRPANIARGDEEQVLWGRPWFRERLCEMEFELQAQSFFQTNTWGAEVLVGAIRRLLGGRREEWLLDLYCGAGTLGLLLAGSFGKVIGVESVPQAIADARRNAQRNGIRNARFVEAAVEEWIRAGGNPGPTGGETAGDRSGESPTALFRPLRDSSTGVLVDPPRAGLHGRVVRGLLDLAPPWILYVSCNPSTLARDAALFVEGGYRPDALQIVDLFPHTAHVESVLLLVRST